MGFLFFIPRKSGPPKIKSHLLFVTGACAMVGYGDFLGNGGGHMDDAKVCAEGAEVLDLLLLLHGEGDRGGIP